MSRQPIRLSDRFTYGKLIRFSLPSISTMIFTSLYGIVDGFFVSNYVGATAFASLNLVMPFLIMISGIGFMFGTGGSALVAVHLGMKEEEKANRYFSMIVYTMIAAGILLGSIGLLLAEPASHLMGADDAMMPYCLIYLRINLVGIVFFMMQQLFQSFLITAEKPHFGFVVTLLAGCTNMLLDWLLVGTLNLGLAGAAWATVLSQVVGGVIPLAAFLLHRNWIIRLGRTNFEWKVIAKACGNGVSEFLTNISASVVGMLYNLQLIRYAGENGVAAYGVIMYVSFIFAAVYIGYTMGVSPVIGYHSGAQNFGELKSLFRKSLVILTVTNVTMTVMAELFAQPLSGLFVSYQPDLYTLTVRGMRIFSVAFLAMGYNCFSSAFFTALNNGAVSAFLSTMRSLVLQLIMVLLLPLVWGIDGVWAAVLGVEGISLLLSAACFMRYGKKYGYL